MTHQLIAPGRGAGVLLARGQHLRIIDPEGGQSGDLLAMSVDGRHRMSSGRTFDYGGKLYVSTGDVLWSDSSVPMLTIVADDVGRHDFLYAPCSVEMYRLQYGVGAADHHPNCRDSLTTALRELGLEPGPLPSQLNVFMNVEVDPGDGGRLVLRPPRSRAGDAIVVRAELDLAIAISACPASLCNGGVAVTKPLAFEVLPHGNR